ncbi:Uncharacterized protein EbC_pEb17201690 (plasmid) [Erwinia billingiae Eb661]|uniref:Uncharacterized protein n=1 Tax=Erwinia billingiae (strain Eb661) TaxID=634500 RepID=D8MK24_ERWBE|nr:Uncharacterized protein EbC_pEb17201690 [Erwinia billingiae Eb661]
MFIASPVLTGLSARACAVTTPETGEKWRAQERHRRPQRKAFAG